MSDVGRKQAGKLIQTIHYRAFTPLVGNRKFLEEIRGKTG